MTISLRIIRQYIILCITFLLAMGIVAVSGNITVHIISFIFACIVPIIMVKADVFHPYCWFSAFFCIYSISYPLLHVIGYSLYGYNKEIVIYELLALFVALLIISPRQYTYGKKAITEKFVMKTGILNYAVFVLTALLLVLGAIYISRSGFLNKKQIYENTGILMTAVFRIPLVLSILFPFLVVDTYNKKGKLPYRYLLIGLISITAITALSGERDLLFRFIVIIVLLLFFLGFIKKRHFIILGAIFAVSIPISSVYKYYFLSGNLTSKMNRGFVYAFLTSDFNSASQNLQFLVSRTTSQGVLGFGRIFEDFVSLFSDDVKSLTAWYNQTYFLNAKSGKGFSLVGEGYVMGGVAGIIVVFIIVGIIIRLFYSKSKKNIYLFSAYLYFITLMIYSIRGDLSTIFSGIIKQILPVEIVVFILATFSFKKHKHFIRLNRHVKKEVGS